MNPRIIRRLRLLIMRVALWLSLPTILWVAPVWPEEELFGLLLWSGGVMLLLAGVFGRIWCTLYIGGRKKIELITDGPYALCRNPLYLFSFFFGLGATLALHNLVLTLLLVGTYVVTHLLTIPFEEARLAETFGDAYRHYRRNTPCLLPRPRMLLSLTRKPDDRSDVCCGANGLRRAVWDGLLYCLAIPAGEWVARLYELHALPLQW